MNFRSPAPFVERLHEAVDKKGAPVVVGLDPRPELFPPDLSPNANGGGDAREAAARAVVKFNELILDAIYDVAVAVKPQVAFYERWGWPGLQALEKTMVLARERGLLVIADGKRNDIGSTAEAYARTWLGDGSSGGAPSGLEADALTVNPYLGTDGLAPFVDRCHRGKAVFVLLRTSNPSGDELQGLQIEQGPNRSGEGVETVAGRVGKMVQLLNEGLPRVDGYGPVGAVVGATRPEEARALRSLLPGVLFLVPGYGAQGAGAAEAKEAFDPGRRGALVNSARGILYAYRAERPGEEGSGPEFAAAARRAALAMRAELLAALGK